jgi:hypothetical protein
MDLPLCAHMSKVFLELGYCNHFAVTADKGTRVFDGLDGMSVCVCVYISVCVYKYIYI